MITFDTTHILWGDVSTKKPISGLIIWYATPKKGKIVSYLMQAEQDDEGIWRETNSIAEATKEFDDMDFGADILMELHAIYISELEQYNPKVSFTNSLNQERAERAMAK